MVLGDTCDAIAASKNVNTTLLHENNPQIDPKCDNIYVGEVLCVANTVIVPPPVSGQSVPMPFTATPAVPSSTTTPAVPSSTPSPQSGDDGDNDDLPYCDEL